MHWFGRLRAGRSFAVGKFGRNVLIVFSGAACAQVIAVGLSPILSRLYSPAQFGELGLFTAVTQVLSQCASGKYEMAINLPEEDSQGQELAKLGISLSLAFGVLLLLICAALYIGARHWLFLSGMGVWLLVIPFFVALTGISASATGLCNRKGLFKFQAKVGVARTTASGALSIFLGFCGFNWSGLICGLVLGQFVAVFWLLRYLAAREGFRLGFSEILNWKKRRLAAVRYKSFPKYLIPSGLVESGSLQLPIFILGNFYGMAAVGLFSFTNRIINLPMVLLGKSFGDVFRHAAAERFTKAGECELLFGQTVRKLSLLALPVGLGLFLCPWVFSFVFGVRWREAGEYAQILSLMMLIRFVSSPVSVMFYIAEKQRLDLLIQTALFITLGVALGTAGEMHLPVKIVVGIYGLVYLCKYLTELFLAARFARGAAK